MLYNYNTYMYVVIYNVYEQLFQCSGRLKRGVWIGLRLNTSSPGCTYSWTDGSTYSNYKQLDVRQRCVKLNVETLDIGSLHCTAGRHFLCEIMGNCTSSSILQTHISIIYEWISVTIIIIQMLSIHVFVNQKNQL